LFLYLGRRLLPSSSTLILLTGRRVGLNPNVPILILGYPDSPFPFSKILSTLAILYPKGS
jgi:hypothetical protein